MNHTFALIKPDVIDCYTEIIETIHKEGFRIVVGSYIQPDIKWFEDFYKEHEGKPHYKGLIEFMTSGPSFGMVLHKENAIEKWRFFIGNTNPEKCLPFQLRYVYGTGLPKNAFHGSDSEESFKREFELFKKSLSLIKL